MKIKLLRLLAFAIMPFPLAIKLYLYRYIFGYKIGDSVKIGFTLIQADRLSIGNNVIIGHFNRIKNLLEVNIGDYVTIGDGNYFTSTNEFRSGKAIAGRQNCPTLNIGCHVGISKFHYFDVQDKFEIGSFTTIAGRGSVFFTHYLNIQSGTQSTKPIKIGNYCMIGSCARFVPGARVPDYSVVAMGSVVTKAFTRSHVLIAGNPATVIKSFPEDAIYFNRTMGWIGQYCPPPW